MFDLIVGLLAIIAIVYCVWAIFTPQGKEFVKQLKDKQSEEKKQRQSMDDSQIWIIYQKESGEVSFRHIQVINIYEDFDLYCRAIDLEKQAERTFKVNRIKALGHKKGSKQYKSESDIVRLLQKSELQSNDRKYLLDYTSNDGETKSNYIEIVELKKAKKGHWYISAKVDEETVLSYRIDRIVSLDTGHQIITEHDNILAELDKFKEF